MSMDNHYSFTMRISMNQRNSIPVHFVDWPFQALQTPANQWLPIYHASMISSNILSSQRDSMLIYVDLTWILRRYVEDQISTYFHVISTNFFNVISLIENCTSFPRTFFNVVWMVEKSTLFPRTFLDVISMVEKSTLQPRTFFDVISLVGISTAFLLTFFNLILMVEKFTFFARKFFKEFFMNSTSFLVSCKLMKTSEGVFLCQ